MFGLFKNKSGQTTGSQMTGSQMAEEGLRQVSIAIQNNAIELHQGRIWNDIYVHPDNANGFPRYTYVMFSPTVRNQVIARCVVLFDRAHGPMPIWQIDWAVEKTYRKEGFGLAIAAKSLAEFTAGMKNKFDHGYTIEAIVDEGNEASAKIARTVLGGEEVSLNKKSNLKSHSFLKRFR